MEITAPAATASRNSQPALGGGVVEAAPHFREWFMDRIREHTILRAEQRRVTSLALVRHLDMAGARGAALAALQSVI